MRLAPRRTECFTLNMPEKAKGPVVSLPFLCIPYYAFGLIGVSLLVVTIYGMVNHSDKVTATHCKVSKLASFNRTCLTEWPMCELF